MQGQAQDLGGNWIAVNDLNFSERYLDAVKRVKPADLQRVPANTSPRQTGRFTRCCRRARTQDNRRERPFRRKCIKNLRCRTACVCLLKEDHRCLRPHVSAA